MKQIYLVLTEKCNLMCNNCIRDSKRNIYMSTAVAKRIIDEISTTLPETDLILTGGEPTIHPEFPKIVEYACDSIKRIIVTSNGTTEYYSHIKYRENVKYQISIDGNRYCHNKLRGLNCYDKIFENIEKLKSQGSRFSVATTVNNFNYKSLKELYEDLVDINAGEWYVNNMLPVGCAMQSNENPLDTALWNDLVYTLNKNCGEIDLRMFTQFDMRKETIQSILRREKKCVGCGAGEDKIYVFPDLNVYACTCLKSITLGNLVNETLLNIIRGDVLQRLLDFNPKKDSPCYNCELFSLCKGGCKGVSLNYFGQLGYGDIRCPKVRERYV